ncbi:abl interactor 2-like isoform X2 [Panonychus citri]|uniref:abl interactor 2-like isoform X2 n=1 Tax=Panonychus citri TaxID=50023 RepID=UPI00230774AB|nr:abl interactor 2-like isoform X2 [Panonychus citri]
MSDLFELIQNDIPEGRQNLQDSHSNLELVAKYCEDNYFRAEDKKAALEETKNYTTQSLASVAYQINTLAYNLIHMLDLQGSQLAEMESQINHINQTVNIHKEKVARREIGVLTANKSTYRQHKILVPANPERPVKYTRKPIDYSILDDIGHGVKIATTNAPRTKRLSGSNQINGSNSMTMGRAGTAPTTKPPTPPGTLRGSGSLSRSSKEYRTPAPPVAPPQVPSNYAPNYPIGHPKGPDSARRGSGYSTLPVNMAHSGGQISAAMQAMQIQDQYQQQLQSAQQAHHQLMQQNSGDPTYQQTPTYSQGLQNNSQQDLMHRRIYQERPMNIVPPSPTPPLPPPPPVNQDIGSNRDSLPEPPPLLQQASIPGNVIAVYDYIAQADDELSFSENSVIYVIKKNEDGWYEGVMDGITGLFPGNYVEPCL